ncbi:MAG: carbohydrate ABC transporter substrate-binding protein, partial [Actinomycetota bacterium]|nr:carbohydrate ABC transporter substrate-binding protein [Actinomycetota bacterium]
MTVSLPRLSFRRPLALVCLLTLVMAGCAGGGDNDTGTAGDTDTGAVPENVGGTMEVAAVWSGEEQAAFN